MTFQIAIFEKSKF